MLLAEVALVVDGSVADEAIGDVDIVSVSSSSSPSRFLFDEILFVISNSSDMPSLSVLALQIECAPGKTVIVVLLRLSSLTKSTVNSHNRPLPLKIHQFWSWSLEENNSEKEMYVQLVELCSCWSQQCLQLV